MSDHPTISFDESNNIRVLSDQHMQVNFYFIFWEELGGAGLRLRFYSAHTSKSTHATTVMTQHLLCNFLTAPTNMTNKNSTLNNYRRRAQHLPRR